VMEACAVERIFQEFVAFVATKAIHPLRSRLNCERWLAQTLNSMPRTQNGERE
jgi:hypothetical protein